jgi:hypothetical protein
MAVVLRSWESAGFTANEEWAVVEEAMGWSDKQDCPEGIYNFF